MLENVNLHNADETVCLAEQPADWGNLKTRIVHRASGRWQKYALLLNHVYETYVIGANRDRQLNDVAPILLR
jgi:hypothetical protein